MPQPPPPHINGYDTRIHEKQTHGGVRTNQARNERNATQTP